MLRRLVVAAAVAALAASPAGATGPPACDITSIGRSVCNVIFAPITHGDLSCVGVGYCAPGSNCTVNVGYCAPGGNCVVNVGYCDDDDLPVGV